MSNWTQKDNDTAKGLTRLFWIFFIFALIGLVGSVGWLGYQLWKVLM